LGKILKSVFSHLEIAQNSDTCKFNVNFLTDISAKNHVNYFYYRDSKIKDVVEMSCAKNISPRLSCIET